MSWRITADPERYQEALDWFLKKNHVPADIAKELEARAKRRAFWVSGAGELRLYSDVFDEIEHALANGTSLGEFKKAVKAKLEAAWAGSVKNPGHRVELIYRNNVQAAYAAGRWHQLQHPALVKYRPFLMYDAVLDARTSEICQACNKTTLPRDDPWWDGHTPPLHHACRSSVRALTKRQGERQGVTGSPPTIDGEVVAAQDGFGATPTDIEWQPQADQYPPALWREFENKTQDAPA